MSRALLGQTRESIAGEIDGTFAEMQASISEISQRYYFKFGGLFLRLEQTFDSKGEYVSYCRKRFKHISDGQRNDYRCYFKKLGGRLEKMDASTKKLKPLRQVTRENVGLPRREQYKRIVDEVTANQVRFEVERQKRDNEQELVRDLANKIINAGYRVLSVKMHPDKNGGSNDAQRRLNAARKLLEGSLLRGGLPLMA